MSTYMRSKAKVEDFVMFSGPYGSFYLRPTVRPVLMLAGGTGLAPFLSMLQWLKDNPTEQPIRLAYGVNTNADLVELELLDELKASLPDFDYLTCVVDRESGHPRLGYVTNHLQAELLYDGGRNLRLRAASDGGRRAQVDGAGSASRRLPLREVLVGQRSDEGRHDYPDAYMRADSSTRR
jgi:ferredoxin-NADP reductase